MTENPTPTNSWRIYWIYALPVVIVGLLVLSQPNLKIEQFYFLGQSISTIKQETIARNEIQLKEIVKKAKKRGTADSRKTSLDARAVRKETQELLKWISDLQEELIEKTGGRDEEHGGLFKSAAHPVDIIMLGDFGKKNDMS